MTTRFPEKRLNAAFRGGGQYKRRLFALSFLVGLLMAAQASAAAVSIATFLSPQIVGMPLADLHKRTGAMECAIGSGGARDCFIALPFGTASRTGGNDEAKVFVRTWGGRVGQVIVNGPIGQLARVLDLLTHHYGVSDTAISRVSASTSCTELSQWHREGRSVLVKVCRSPLGGGGDFVVNVLADWYVLSHDTNAR